MSADIDAVVTWVDGSDPDWRKAMMAHSVGRQERALTQLPSGKSPVRYKDNGEIEYCLKGIRRMMPWIRNIFLITANQRPSFLDPSTQERLGIVLVDHHEIFAELGWALPTFNSISIETVLHRIPGLADRFVYLNDDVVPLRPSAMTDFFLDDAVVLRGEWERLKHYGALRTLASGAAIRWLSKLSKKDYSAHLLVQMRAAELVGYNDRYFHCAHAPHPLHVSTLRDFFSAHPNALKKNISYRFRSLHQFGPCPLAHHLEASRGSAVVRDATDTATINFGKPAEVEHAIQRLDVPETKFACIQSLELAPDHVRRHILDLLRSRILHSSTVTTAHSSGGTSPQ